MTDRPSYLVIIPSNGLFSAHWTEYDAFRMADKLISQGTCLGDLPYVVEVPQTDGISVSWKLERPIEEARSADERPPQGEHQPDTQIDLEDAIRATGGGQ
jgi:hypothetical protein